MKVTWKFSGVEGALQWRHNGRDSVWNHQPHHCLLNRLLRRRTKKTSKLRVIGLCARNSLVTGAFHAQMASNADFFSNWWRHHGPEQRYPAAGAPPPFHQSVAGGRVTQMMNLIQQKWNEYTLYRKGSVITRNHIHIFHMFISTGNLHFKNYDLSVIHSRLNMKLSKELGESKYCGIFLAATKQLCGSVRPSVRLSVCPPITSFSLCSHHRIRNDTQCLK